MEKYKLHNIRCKNKLAALKCLIELNLVDNLIEAKDYLNEILLKDTINLTDNDIRIFDKAFEYDIEHINADESKEDEFQKEIEEWYSKLSDKEKSYVEYFKRYSLAYC
jgi:hypothetical protein